MKFLWLLLGLLVLPGPVSALTLEFSPPEVMVLRGEPFTATIIVTVDPDDMPNPLVGLRVAWNDILWRGSWVGPAPQFVCAPDGDPLYPEIPRLCWDSNIAFDEARFRRIGSFTLGALVSFQPNWLTSFTDTGPYIYQLNWIASNPPGAAGAGVLIINVVDDIEPETLPICNKKRHHHQDHAHSGKGAQGIYETAAKRHKHARLCNE